MLIDDFSAALSEEEHSVKQVHNDKKKNILPLPIFFVDLHPKDTDHEV